MDYIFQKTTSIFTVVGIAKREPRRYDKDGNLLIDFHDTEQARRHSLAGRQGSAVAGSNEKAVATGAEVTPESD